MRYIHDIKEKKISEKYNYTPVKETFNFDKTIFKDLKDWNIGLIVGKSGSGKSTLLRQISHVYKYKFNINKSIISNFNMVNDEDIESALNYCGLSSIPVWFKKYKFLSNGEKHRANLSSIVIKSKEDDKIFGFDEFTSYLDRETAKAVSYCVQKYFKKNNKKIILSTCHKDIIDWLNPDWIYNTDENCLIKNNDNFIKRPEIKLEIKKVSCKDWNIFSKFHYAGEKISPFSKCFGLFIGKNIIGFISVIRFPNYKVKNAYRESRLVILPEYQGFGLGNLFSNIIASIYYFCDKTYYSRTSHAKIINHRIKSEMWKPICKNNKSKKGLWQSPPRKNRGFKFIKPIEFVKNEQVFEILNGKSSLKISYE